MPQLAVAWLGSSPVVLHFVSCVPVGSLCSRKAASPLVQAEAENLFPYPVDRVPLVASLPSVVVVGVVVGEEEAVKLVVVADGFVDGPELGVVGFSCFCLEHVDKGPPYSPFPSLCHC